MEEISIKEKSISISGVKSVVGIADKEAEVIRDSGKVAVFGTNIQAQKLTLEQGILVLSFDNITAVKFGNATKKFSFKNLFN